VEVCEVLNAVAAKEGFVLPPALAMRISQSCERNLRRAILTLEACRAQQYPFTENQMIQQPDWLVFIHALAHDIVAEQSRSRLLEVRDWLYDLLSMCIPPETIMQYLTQALVQLVPQRVQHKTLHRAAKFEHGLLQARMDDNDKNVVHIEAFVARFMVVYMPFRTFGTC
jgi:replication factor C subunit 3/5